MNWNELQKNTVFCDWPLNLQNWHGLQLNSWIGSKMLRFRCERSCFCVRSAIHTIFMQFSRLTCNPFKNCNPDAIQIDCARHPRIVCQLCSCSGGITSSLGCNSRSSQNCEVLWNCPWINQLLMEFPKWNGLRIDWRIVIGFLGMLWHRATLPQSSG